MLDLLLLLLFGAGVAAFLIRTYGLAMGLGAALGNYVGKRLLSMISSRRFRQFVIALMVISGILMVWQSLA